MNRDEYLARMQRCPQFGWWPGVAPLWMPGMGDVEGFCHDEVVRQGHNPNDEGDGGVRIEGMLRAWEYAQEAVRAGLSPDPYRITFLAYYIEPHMNSLDLFRTMDVFIGGAKGAPPRLLRQLVHMLVELLPVRPLQEQHGPHANRYRETWKEGEESKDIIERCQQLMYAVSTADDWYLAFEAIHPFADGNGRTGKVLHNWLMGTLDEPVLVRDYFGGGNP